MKKIFFHSRLSFSSSFSSLLLVQMATYPVSAVRQVAGYGVLSVRSQPLSVLAEGPVYSSVTFSPSVHSPTIHHPSDLFPSRVGKMVNPDAKETYAPNLLKKKQSSLAPSSPYSLGKASNNKKPAAAYFHFASLHHHPSASLFSLQSYRAFSTNTTHTKRSPFLPPKALSPPCSTAFLSSSQRLEDAGEQLIDLASRVVKASGL